MNIQVFQCKLISNKINKIQTYASLQYQTKILLVIFEIQNQMKILLVMFEVKYQTNILFRYNIKRVLLSSGSFGRCNMPGWMTAFWGICFFVHRFENLQSSNNHICHNYKSRYNQCGFSDGVCLWKSWILKFL